MRPSLPAQVDGEGILGREVAAIEAGGGSGEG